MKTNMYKNSVKQWRPFVGCGYACSYCRSSFQDQLKRWAKSNCPQCYEFEPHSHENRLNQRMPHTSFMQFIFVCASSDISFCPTEHLAKIVDRMRDEPNKTFLLQSKNPKTFDRVQFSKNVILGTTLETNIDDIYEGISKAPRPSKRYKDFVNVAHPAKMVTVEPVLDFDINVMVSWIENIQPCMVWLGYDSRKNHLPEPPLEKVKSFYWELGTLGFRVMLKTIREAWWEQAGAPTPERADRVRQAVLRNSIKDRRCFAEIAGPNRRTGNCGRSPIILRDLPEKINLKKN